PRLPRPDRAVRGRLAAVPAGPPLDDDVVPAPAAVARLAGEAPVRAVWRNEVGGLTFAIGEPPARYVKWLPAGVDPALADLAAEAARLRWAGPHTPVPEVLDLGADGDGSWLVTRAIRGTSAVDPRWRAEPATAVRAIARGLRSMHEELPVEACPFDWSPAHRLGHLQPAFEHRRDELSTPPPADLLVVCHGDPCAPNTLLDDAGRWVAHVDLGALGVADRWADLAVATMSLGWNYGEGWEPAFFDAYGVEPDPERITYHRRLWDST
ncbi:MAG TPA: aminoglycoside 3'-phosphotransferase, partial [Acidimicrobiales bacterium]|nr:aminoglycoside 3'-phosphotransferase [Acidimicrobiales bacterium]